MSFNIGSQKFHEGEHFKMLPYIFKIMGLFNTFMICSEFEMLMST